jgi:biopolymer transport protein ExbB
MTEITPWQIFLMGGPLMWPILACSIISLTVIIQKMLLLTLVVKESATLSDTVILAVRKNEIQQAIEACDTSSSLLGGIFKSGLLKFACVESDITEAMHSVVKQEVSMLESGMNILATMVTVAPLLGILGTVLGLSNVLYLVQIRTEAINPITTADVTTGVWHALITTASALMVSVVALMAHNYLAGKILDTVRGLERSSAVLLSVMTSSTEGDVIIKEDV